MPWQTLVAQFEQVRPMIAAAPGLFALVVMACLLVAWGFVHLLHRQSFKNKETEIGHKNAEIAWLRQQKEDAEKRLGLAQAAPSRADTTVGAADPASAGSSAQLGFARIVTL